MRIDFETEPVPDVLYCNTDDVARFFEQYDDFTSSTNPTETDVQEHILEQMEYIDRQTGHAWRANQVIDEVRDLDTRYYWWSGVPVPVSKREIRDPDSAEGDKIEAWNGNEYNDWVTDTSRVQGRDEDYWIDHSGVFWLRDRYIFKRHPRLRLTYRYGNPDGPTKSIQQATAKLVAADLLASDQYSMNVPGTDGGVGSQEAMQKWREDAEEVISERENVSYVEGF